MKRIVILSIIILMMLTTSCYAKAHAHAHAHSVHSSGHSTSHSTSKSKISGAKKYSTPKSFKGKYNSSNIKTEKVTEAKNYSNYSTSNTFRPNFLTDIWAFQCMKNNSQEVTEQDIAKELEERGYSQEEIKEILKEGEQAKEEIEKEAENKKETAKKIATISIIILISILLILLIVMNLIEKRW